MDQISQWSPTILGDAANIAALAIVRSAVNGQVSPEDAVKQLNSASVIKEVSDDEPLVV